MAELANETVTRAILELLHEVAESAVAPAPADTAANPT